VKLFGKLFISKLLFLILILINPSNVLNIESRAVARYIDAKSGNKLSRHNNLAEWGRVETWASVEAFNWDKYASGTFFFLF
jgi:hypothetical protein